jgi:tetratricopeptide (TPR) repeat protein
MIERQLEALDEPTLAVLEAGAVAGEEFDAPAVAVALGEVDAERAEDCCDLLVRQGRLVTFLGESAWPDGTGGARYGFRHALYRDVLYDRIPPSRRRRLHQLIGERLERAHAADATPVAADLGSHFESSRDQTRAIRYLGQAADTAQKRFADREAVAYLERALALLDTLPESPERTQQELLLRLLLSPSLTVTFGHASPELARSSGRVRALLQDGGETPGHLFALLALVAFELMRGRLDAATEIAERALDLAPRVAPGFITIGNLAGGMARCYRGEFERGRRHLEAALAGDPPDGWPVIFDPPSVALSHLADRVLVYLGYPDAAVVRGQETLARADALGHPFQQAAATSTIARMFVVLRDPHAALALADRCLRLCADHGFRDIVHRTQIVHRWARAALGDADGVVEELRASLETYGERAGMVAITSAHLTVAEAATFAGRFEDALHVVLTAARLVEETGERMEEAEVHRWRGEILLALRGRQAWPEARECFLRALDVARGQAARWFELRAATSLARLDASRGQPGEGRVALAAALAWFTEGHGRPDLVEAQSVLAQLR